MKRKVVLRPIAQVEIASAANSYSLVSAERHRQFLFEVDQALQFIEENPRASAIRPYGMRRRNLKNFPRALLYLVVKDFDDEWNEEVEKLVVLGCVHQKQDDAVLAQRLDL